MAEPRTTRDDAVRGLQERNPEEFRKHQWKPSEALPMPKAPPGWHYRYIRKSIGGWQDVQNFGRAMRDGWVTVPLSDHPELSTSINPDAKNSGMIEIGALILCKIPMEIKQQMDLFDKNMTDRQMEAVDSNLMKANDPRMPLFAERDTKVTFGRGN